MAEVKERPIIFSSEMVRAILNNQKIITRRAIKNAYGAFWDHAGYYPKEHFLGVFRFYFKDSDGLADLSPEFHCPYGQKGEHLWIKETWGLHYGFVYKADNKSCLPSGGWKSPLFMPRKAARIILEIINVRIEKLQDIRPEDLQQEGIKIDINDEVWTMDNFIKLWDSLNAKHGYGWQANPWVWVIQFKKAKP